MTDKTISPHGENLRNAIRWLSEQYWHQPTSSGKTQTREIIEKASVMFDLTPLEEEFLIRKFVKQEDSIE